MSTMLDEKLSQPLPTRSTIARAQLKHLQGRQGFQVLDTDATGPRIVCTCPMDTVWTWCRVNIEGELLWELMGTGPTPSFQSPEPRHDYKPTISYVKKKKKKSST
jgi:hypothetical protein